MFRTGRGVLLLVAVAIVTHLLAQSSDFSIAREAFEEGHYTIAETYFKAVLHETPHSEHVPDAAYYLARIHAVRNNFIAFMHTVHQFIEDYQYDTRSRELLMELLDRLMVQQSYSTVYEYLEEYDYLIDDEELLCRVALGLYDQKNMKLAEHVLSKCPLQDTILILQASLSDEDEKRQLYEKVGGVKGSLYSLELLLNMGDTITAYDIYTSIDNDIGNIDLLYRFAKASVVFSEDNLRSSLVELKKTPGYKKKASYLSALVAGEIKEFIVPDDEEEYRLLRRCLEQQVIYPDLPDSNSVSSILPDSFGYNEIADLRQAYPDIFILDSLCCENLIREGRIDDAFNVIAPYLDYTNTKRYARFVRAMKLYREKKYEEAIKDIILSQNNQTRARYLLAKMCAHLGQDPVVHYEAVLDAHIDSTFRVKVQQELIEHYFNNERYHKIIHLPYEIVVEDESLIRLYLSSLARTGAVHKADSLSNATFGTVDYELTNYYGEYLIANRAYKTARVLYDSLYYTSQYPLPPRIQYTWALVPLLEGDTDTALFRFKQFVTRVQPDRPYYLGMFKSATIHYVREEFDSAAYYYGLASEDDSLRLDALQNQLICYKKTAEWKGVMNSAKQLLPLVKDTEAAEVNFEYGYAELRYGDFRNAIDHFKQAIYLAPSAEYFYWLGEVYLGRGDFIRALYQYRKIVDLYPEDDMWTPTAQYKVGIVLEFMDEFVEARKLYIEIIEKRGAGDTWGIEAQKRLEQLE